MNESDIHIFFVLLIPCQIMRDGRIIVVNANSAILFSYVMERTT